MVLRIDFRTLERLSNSRIEVAAAAIEVRSPMFLTPY
jgi:hypothetical protein